MSSPLASWPRTRLTELLRLSHPIIQGPFGGGLSSVALASAVARCGGLGSFGVHHLEPDGIAAVGAELRSRAAGVFALNLWVSTHDLDEASMTRSRFDAAVARLQPLYDEFGVDAPEFPERFSPTFEEQASAVLAARPPVFSFVFGVPDDRVLTDFRAAGIRTIGTATTPDEAVALDEAGVDAIVASGYEAGGHRGAFLAPVEDSLVGTLALVRTAASEVRAPVVAAGGIADAQGVVAALALGAEGVQLGSAFLATEESGTTPEHRAVLLDGGARRTTLTRAFTGRLARGVPNRLTASLEQPEPYPYQSYLLRPVIAAARAQGRTDVVSLWAGQGTSLLRERRAADVYDAVVSGTDTMLSAHTPTRPTCTPP
ncbi:NAD(P)H-dependent flavin oxidoreductase [Solirubrobacter soli]|uniref:NAD(P)H-dependent flavin oxidoreductase n=1 Tax=Solirubrobacter soli TaxID=363832 RepID=UPI00040ED482|nr:nitronate monooxygenase [Solirubrobacter soli]